MKQFYISRFATIILALFFSAGLMAQQTTVTVKVEKDGKVVKDTSYTFEDEVQAKHAMKMMDLMSGDDEHMVKVHKEMLEGHGGQAKTMVFISEDGETTEIKEFSGDSLVWVREGDHEGENVKVIKYKYKVDEDDDVIVEHEGDHMKVIKIKEGDGESFSIVLEEDLEGDDDGEKTVTKEVRVIVSDDED